MASSDQIKALIRSHAEGDDIRFHSVGLQMAASEARKGHVDLAKELRDLVEPAAVRTLVTEEKQDRGDKADKLQVQHRHPAF